MSTKPSDPIETDAFETALRDWRYAVNAFHLEATDCREMFRLAASVARRDDACRLIREGRERLSNALRELESAHRTLLDRLESATVRDEGVLNELLAGFRVEVSRWGALDTEPDGTNEDATN
jgi:hypothetical protein